MTDFSAFGISDAGTYKMPLINPRTGTAFLDADGKEAWIEVSHYEGPEGEAFDHSARQDRAAFKAKGHKSAGDMYVIAKLAHLTKDWYLVGADGQPLNLAFSTAAAAELYESQAWVHSQVFAAANAYGNFSRPLSKS